MYGSADSFSVKSSNVAAHEAMARTPSLGISSSAVGRSRADWATKRVFEV